MDDGWELAESADAPSLKWPWRAADNVRVIHQLLICQQLAFC